MIDKKGCSILNMQIRMLKPKYHIFPGVEKSIDSGETPYTTTFLNSNGSNLNKRNEENSCMKFEFYS